MKWFHAADGTPTGPFDADEIHALVRSGKILPATLAWHEGLAEWKPFSELAADLPPATAAEPIEPEESSPALADEPVPGWESAPEDGEPLPAPARLQQLLLEGRSFSIREAFSRGWETVAHQPALTLGAFFLYFLVGLFMEWAGILGTLASAPLLAGAYWLNLRILRGESASWKDLLTPARRAFLPIVMVQLLLNLVVAALSLPFQSTQTIELFGQKKQLVGIDFFHSIGGGLAFTAILYLMVMYLFVLPLVIDQRLRVWEAVLWSFRFVSHHFFKVLLFGVLLAVFAFAGFFIFLIGFFLTVPICLAALCAAYVRLFTPGDSGAPPPPSLPGAAAPPDSRR